MGKFDKYVGKVSLKIDGEEFVVKPTNRQVAKFLAMDKDKAKSEEGFVNMTDALKEMFTDAYPDEDKDNIESFVLQKMDVILKELVVKMGWVKEKDINKELDKGKEKGAKKA